MRSTPLSASALVRPATVLTVPGGGAAGGDGGGGIIRGPQSVQSVPRLQSEYSAPAPPSSQIPSEAWLHVSVQACAVCSSRRWLGRSSEHTRQPYGDPLGVPPTEDHSIVPGPKMKLKGPLPPEKLVNVPDGWLGMRR